MSEACVVCGERPAVHSHHRQMRSQGGSDESVNLLRVCLDCHTWIHANPSDAYARGLLVHSWADPALVRTFLATPETPNIPIQDGEHPVAEGEVCPRCERRKPHAKKASSPKSKVFSTRIPLDDVETFNELVDAAAEHMQAKSKPYHVYNALLVGLALVLQTPKEHLPNG